MGEDEARGLRPDLLLFAAFFATLPLYSPNLSLFQDGFADAGPVMGVVAPTMLVAAVACGRGAAVLAARGRGGALLRPGAVVAGAVLYVGGYALLAAQLASGASPGVVAVAAGLLLAVGSVGLCVAWGAGLACLGLRRALVLMGLTVGCGSVLELLIAAVPVAVGVPVVGALAVAAGAVPCAWALRGGWPGSSAAPASAAAGTPEAGAQDAAAEPGEAEAPFAGEPGGAADDAGAFCREEGESLSRLLRRMAGVLAVPLVGLLVFGYITGVRRFMMFDVVYMEALGGLLAGLVAVPLGRARTRRPLLPFLHQVVLPAFALVLIVLNSFPEATPPLWVAAWLSYVFFGLVAILALASLCAMAHAGEFPPALVYGAAVAGYAVVSLLGQVSGTTAPFEAQNGGPALLVVSTLYFVFLLASSLAAGWRVEERAPSDAASDGAAALAERCARVAGERGLSPREGEILGYLGRGHTVAFIAKTLVISESTVRTHVKAVYRKLGVSSREELLEFIDGPAR